MFASGHSLVWVYNSNYLIIACSFSAGSVVEFLLASNPPVLLSTLTSSARVCKLQLKWLL